MNTPDTTLVVAAFSEWHEHHLIGRRALATTSAVGGHVALECFSVLTRIPVPIRATPAIVVEFLNEQFPGEKLTLSPIGLEGLLSLAVSGDIAGGAIYDALVAATAKEAGMTLLSLDARAAPTYRKVGVDFQILS